MKPDPAAERLARTRNQREELARRSEAHRQNPGEAIPLDDAIDRIERSLALVPKDQGS